MTSSNMSSPSSSSVPLSPKLEERRNAREARDKPWRWGSKDYPEMTPPPRPAFRFKVTVHRKCGTAPKFPSEPFPFTKLPFDIQILVGEFAARYKTKVKVSDFLPQASSKKATQTSSLTKARRTLDSNGQPEHMPLAVACPYLLPEMSRAWYRSNVFYVRTVPELQSFAELAGPENMNRIHHLQVENDLIYCTGSDFSASDSISDNTPAISKCLRDDSWRSYALLTPLKNLRTLTLFRDDGGPETYTGGGNDEFNSVEWFKDLVKGSQSLKRIQFALYPWTGYGEYELSKSNMVAWIRQWERKWDKRLLPRRGGVKGETSWFEVRPPRGPPASAP